MSEPQWPDLPAEWSADPATTAKYRELLLAGKIDHAKHEAQVAPATPKSLADDDSEKKLHETLGTLVGESIERARDGAKFVETAAAALGTVYTGILAFSFAAKDAPMPGRGLYAAIFLGIAIVGASIYLAFVQRIKNIGRVDYKGARPEDQWRRTEYLAAWTRAVVQTRAWALRTGVVALAFGVMFMPLAFLPDRLASNPLVLTEPQTAEAAPTPSASWPAPPTESADPAVLAVLYKAQLDEYVKTKDQAAPSPSTAGINTNALSLVLFTGALLILGFVAIWGWLLDVARWVRARVGPSDGRSTGSRDGGLNPATTDGTA
jgi:hypothetical protein